MQEQLPERCVLDGEVFVRDVRRPAGVRDAPGAHPPRRVAASTCSPRRPRPASWPSTCWRWATSRTSTARSPSAAPRWRRRSAGLDGPCYLTRDDRPTRPQAEEWFDQFEGAGLDGVVAKPLGAPYSRERPHDAQDQARAHRRRRRRGLPRAQDQHARAAAARQPPARPVRRDGELQHIGVSASFTEAAARRADRASSSRWSSRSRSTRGAGGRSSSPPTPTGCRAPRAAGARARTCRFTPLRPDLVIEVAYDHMEGRRFRHTAQFRRWRTDRDPETLRLRPARGARLLRPRRRARRAARWLGQGVTPD